MPRTIRRKPWSSLTTIRDAGAGGAPDIVADPVIGGLSGSVDHLEIANTRLAAGSFPAIEDHRDPVVSLWFVPADLTQETFALLFPGTGGISGSA